MKELKFYGNVRFKNKDYFLTQDAYVDGIYENEGIEMKAIALDTNYQKVMVTWLFVHEENFEIEDYDYSKATSVEYI
jgi:hypothetical protein